MRFANIGFAAAVLLAVLIIRVGIMVVNSLQAKNKCNQSRNMLGITEYLIVAH